MPGGLPQDPGAGGGASGSVGYGSATDLREELRSATAGTQGPTGQPAQPQAAQAPAAPAQQPGPPAAPDAQPPGQMPPPPMGQSPFEPARVGVNSLPPWREQLQIWAAHPRAGQALRYLATLANKDGMLGGR